MAKAKKKVPVKKQRAPNYDSKLAIKGTFEDVLKVSVAQAKKQSDKKS